LSGVPDVESPLFELIFREKELAGSALDVALSLHRDGFAVIDFPDPDFDSVAGAIIEKLHGRYDWHGWRQGTNRNLRVQDAWRDVPEVHRLACNPAVLQLLADVYGRPAFPFQTLSFPVGTQQHFHSDSIHFALVPNGSWPVSG
jgi:hypothetical protein